MLLIQRDSERLGFTLSASTEISRRFSALAEQHGLTLEEVVRRALLPSICAALRSPERDSEHIETLVALKVKTYPGHRHS